MHHRRLASVGQIRIAICICIANEQLKGRKLAASASAVAEPLVVEAKALPARVAIPITYAPSHINGGCQPPAGHSPAGHSFSPVGCWFFAGKAPPGDPEALELEM